MWEGAKSYLRRFPLLVGVYRLIKNRKISSGSNQYQLQHGDAEALKQQVTQTATVDLENFIFSGERLEFPRFSKPVISIIIVTFNRAELTLVCLRSLLQIANCAYEVVVVDNCSTDKTAELFRQVSGVTFIQNEENLHFLLASNQGAKQARGQYLLFLNSDTQILPGTVSAALKVFYTLDAVGAVGAKLILPDDRLQEAGSIVWADGTCLGYGRGDNPFHCQYMYRKEVDYCSGAFLLTPKNLFEKLGGFDAAYKPAYYEEVDYCVRLQKAGFKVIYEPRVVVRHFEFASSKKSENALRMQLERKGIFIEKHRRYLDNQPKPFREKVIFGRQRGHQEKRLLFIDERLPHVATGAGYPRANQIVKTALQAGWFVSVYPAIFVEPNEDWVSIYSDIPQEVEVLALAPFGPGRLKHLLEERQGYYHTVMVSRPTTMQSLAPLFRDHANLFEGAKIVYDAEAIFSLREKKLGELIGKPLSDDTFRSMLEKELLLANGAERITTVCSAEADNFRERGFKDVHVLSHAVESYSSKIDFGQRKGILFLGAIHDDSGPNADSVFWFIDHVLPHLRKLGFEDDFIIAGTNKSGRLNSTAISGVQVLGSVDDPALVYDQAKIFVAPTRFSAGIPLKVIEAAAHGLPVVASVLAGTQLGWEDQKEIMIAQNEQEFAQDCWELYNNQALWQSAVDSAKERVIAEYSHQKFMRALVEVLN